MIRACLFSDASGYLTGFQVKGHADYADEGQDIVCAAVSSLTTTCCNALEKEIGITPDVFAADGHMSCTLPEGISNEALQNAQWMFLFLKTGLSDLQVAYPQNVQLTIEKRRK